MKRLNRKTSVFVSSGNFAVNLGGQGEATVEERYGHDEKKEVIKNRFFHVVF
ncbi:hypothetical protein LEP1GSC125_0482 [Leptospira mayottensis 200901122]|uniref:Uncharacterized protein n=1 Tax=Leptospira mayottensis 200901122 TaxID=1193010 RepID=A0AA87MPI7_9LEPT|nr:hypothetical protein LEP1GSC125_0482 [Leptospira mayottensis 200901122]